MQLNKQKHNQLNFESYNEVQKIARVFKYQERVITSKK